ncbi:hypothetical protein V8F20_008913 [Naviculisporaceae sp. PSN 640]
MPVFIERVLEVLPGTELNAMPGYAPRIGSTASFLEALKKRSDPLSAADGYSILDERSLLSYNKRTTIRKVEQAGRITFKDLTSELLSHKADFRDKIWCEGCSSARVCKNRLDKRLLSVAGTARLHPLHVPHGIPPTGSWRGAESPAKMRGWSLLLRGSYAWPCAKCQVRDIHQIWIRILLAGPGAMCDWSTGTLRAFIIEPTMAHKRWRAWSRQSEQTGNWFESWEWLPIVCMSARLEGAASVGLVRRRDSKANQ